MEKQETVPEFDPFSEDTGTKPSGGGGRWLAVTALLLVLAVAGWNGWEWWQARDRADRSTEVQQALSELQAAQQDSLRLQRDQSRRLEAVERLELASGLARLDEAVEQARGVAGSDRARLAGIESTQGDIAARLDALEGRVAAVVVRGESPRQQLNLAEVDYLLRSANERLLLYGDARTADQALALADEQLAALDDPVYLSVRQSIAAARLALDAVARPDSIALTEGLAGLQAAIPGLPFPGEVVVRTETGAVDTEADPGVWARFKAAVSGLVSVRRQAPDASLVSLQDKDYIRQGLWLQLESARLALLREDDSAYAAALARTASTLEQYFDLDSARAERFASELKRLAAVRLAVEWPDISAPWERLQAIRTVRGTPPESAPPSSDSPEQPAPVSGAETDGPGGEGAVDAEETAETASPEADGSALEEEAPAGTPPEPADGDGPESA